MPNNNDYRDLLNEKFSRVYAQMDANFDLIHEKLKNIEDQTKKTNGRVNKLEDEVEIIKLNEKDHLINCPQTYKIERIEDNLLEYKFMKKYPKISIIAMGIFGITLIILTLAQFGIL